MNSKKAASGPHEHVRVTPDFAAVAFHGKKGSSNMQYAKGPGEQRRQSRAQQKASLRDLYR